MGTEWKVGGRHGRNGGRERTTRSTCSDVVVWWREEPGTQHSVIELSCEMNRLAGFNHRTSQQQKDTQSFPETGNTFPVRPEDSRCRPPLALTASWKAGTATKPRTQNPEPGDGRLCLLNHRPLIPERVWMLCLKLSPSPSDYHEAIDWLVLQQQTFGELPPYQTAAHRPRLDLEIDLDFGLVLQARFCFNLKLFSTQFQKPGRQGEKRLETGLKIYWLTDGTLHNEMMQHACKHDGRKSK